MSPSSRGIGALLGLGVALLMGAGLYLVHAQREAIWQSARESALDIALAMESSISARFGQSVASLRGVATDVGSARADEAGAEAALRNAARYDPFSVYLGLVPRSGQDAVVVDAEGVRVRRGWELVLPSLLEAPPADDAVHVQPLLQLPGRPGWLMPVSLPMPAGRGGFAFALVPAERVVAGADSLKLLHGSRISLISTDGRRLLRHAHGQPELEINGPPLLPERLAAMRPASSANLQFISSVYQSEQIAGYARSSEVPLYVSVLVPVEELTARWLREASGPLGVMLLGLAGVLSFGLRLRRALQVQHHQLEHQRYLATHDALTGLLNREAFVESLNHRIKEGREPAFAVCLLNIGNFKDINDSFGHVAGDQALVEMGQRFSRLLARDATCVARLGGDELVVCMGGAPDEQAVKDFCLRLQDCVHQPLTLNGIELEMSANIGVACYPADGPDAGELIRCADVAMRACKSDLGSFCRYSADLDLHTVDSLSLKSDLARALREGGLAVVYQPKVSLADGRLIGVEALARWQHPVRGAISPARFVPLAENSELIHPFTLQVLDRAIRQAGLWQAGGHALPVAVNISVNNLLDHGFIDHLCAMLDRHAVPAGMLELELTESAVMRHPELTLRRLRALRQLGVRLSIDDFGTGYASLSYLKQLPVHTLKIDKVFILDLERDGGDQRIVRSAIQLAHGFGMTVVAEGVESAAAVDLLRGFGCDAAQGFHFARPLGAGDLELQWLRDAKAPHEHPASAAAATLRNPMPEISD